MLFNFELKVYNVCTSRPSLRTIEKGTVLRKDVNSMNKEKLKKSYGEKKKKLTICSRKYFFFSSKIWLNPYQS